MELEVHTLQLFQDIQCGKDVDSGNGILYECKSISDLKILEPSNEQLLSCGTQEDIDFTIPQGDYLFVQGFLPPERNAFLPDGKPDELLFAAANALFLEFLWKELSPEDDTTYVRLLLHEGDYVDKATGEKKSAGTVFQLFRRTVLK